MNNTKISNINKRSSVIFSKFSVIESYFLYFILYSFTGWLYEVFLEVVVYRWGYSDRGVLIGPYCPVYGTGALLFILLFYKFIKNKNKEQGLFYRFIKMLLIFTGCMISATAVEYAASYICELLTGSWPWQTYFNYKWNFQGRIALSPSLRFGLGGLIFLYIFQPLFERVNRKLSSKSRHIVFIIAVLIFAADLICSLLILL